MTLIVVADQHIGSGANLGDRLADQRSSWTRVCTVAAEMSATVLNAGDVFHSRRASPSEMRAYQAGLDILREAGCEMLVALGNHDRVDMDSPTSVEAASAGYAVHVCREPEVIETPDGVVGFLPWMPPRMRAKQTAEALMIVAEGLAEQGARILVAHWALAGGSLPNGLPLLDLAEPMLDPYALQAQFDLVLAGHIHKRQEIVEGVWHVGPLSRCNFGEASVETGAWQVVEKGYDRGDAPPGFALEASWFEVPDRRFLSIDTDERDAVNPTVELQRDIACHDLHDAIVRVRWQQRADQQVDQAAVRATLIEYGAHHVDALTPIVERIQSVRSHGVSEQTNPHEAWNAWFQPQTEALGDDLAVHVAAAAHRWIEAAV